MCALSPMWTIFAFDSDVLNSPYAVTTGQNHLIITARVREAKTHSISDEQWTP